MKSSIIFNVFIMENINDHRIVGFVRPWVFERELLWSIDYTLDFGYLCLLWSISQFINNKSHYNFDSYKSLVLQLLCSMNLVPIFRT